MGCNSVCCTAALHQVKHEENPLSLHIIGSAMSQLNLLVPRRPFTANIGLQCAVSWSRFQRQRVKDEIHNIWLNGIKPGQSTAQKVHLTNPLIQNLSNLSSGACTHALLLTTRHLCLPCACLQSSAQTLLKLLDPNNLFFVKPLRVFYVCERLVGPRVCLRGRGPMPNLLLTA